MKLILERKARPGWDPHKHPRGRDGRFISSGDRVRLPSGATGEVVGITATGRVAVQRDDGKRQVAAPDQVTHTSAGPARPARAAAAPAKPPSPAAGAARSSRRSAPAAASKPDRERAAPAKPDRAEGSRPPGGKPAAAPSPAEAKKFIDDHYGQWRQELPPKQESALRFYQSPGFALMNGQLRGLAKDDIRADVSFNDADLERARKASKDLTAAIKKAPPLTEDTTVYRGFSADQFGALAAGDVVTDKGFTSTSLTADVTAVGKATSPAVATIRLPAGTRAAAGSSRELVLPPGSKFRVSSVTKRGKTLHVEMELI